MAIRTVPAYCDEEDVLLGDLQLPRTVDINTWIKYAADEIDMAIGQVYQLPLVFDNSRPEDRADALLLKTVNAHLATARILNIIASAGEDALDAYAKSLMGEAKGILGKISNKAIILESASLVEEADGQYNGPIITNRDSGSFVDAFYKSRGTIHGLASEWNAGVINGF